MNPQDIAQSLAVSKEFFDRSTRCLTEEYADYRPVEEIMTAAQQVAHVAQTLDWFIDGAFHRPDGFDMDFEEHMRKVQAVTTLKEAREWLDKSFARSIETISAKTMDELQEPLPEGPVMGGLPKLSIISAMEEHTAHHRGALTVYSRLCGLVPPMPYMEL